MTSALKTWFATRSPRERRLLILMGIIALPILFWLLLLRPLDAAHDEALDRYRLALDRNGRIAAMTGIDQSDIAPPVIDGSIATFLTDHAAQRGVTLSSATDTSGATAEIAIETISAGEFARWVDALEQDGLHLETLRLSPSSDGVLVNASVGSRQ